MRRWLWLLAFLPILPAGGGAGPWPREPGRTFLSLSVERDRDGNSHAGLYAEYGLTPRRTLGVEIGHTNVGETGVLVWIQRALDGGQGPHRLAFSLGAGVIGRGGEWLPVGQAAVGYGRGFEGPWHGGWFAAEAKLKLAGETRNVVAGGGLTRTETTYLTPEAAAKVDLTLGLRPTESTMLVGQLRLEDRRDADFSAKLAVSVVHDLAGPAKLEVGIVEPMSGAGERALKIGTWVEF